VEQKSRSPLLRGSVADAKSGRAVPPRARRANDGQGLLSLERGGRRIGSTRALTWQAEAYVGGGNQSALIATNVCGPAAMLQQFAVELRRAGMRREYFDWR